MPNDVATTATRAAVASLLALSTVACEPPPVQPPQDSGVEQDSGPTPDSATPTPDASIPEPDGATPTPDAATPAGPAASSFLRVGFYNQHVVMGPDQRAHMTFLDGAAERLNYATCANNCGDARAWTVVTLLDVTRLGTATVGPYGIGVDRSGRVHMIASGVPRAGARAWETMYGTCAGDCAVAGNWSFLDVSDLAPGRGLVGTSDTLMVQPGGQVSFLTTGQFNATRPVYFQCESNCATPGQWRAVATPIDGRPIRAAMDSAGVRHVAFSGGRTAANEQLLQYARCAGNCVDAASWQVSMLGFLSNSNDWETGFVIDASDRLFVSFNQGTITQSVALNRRNLVASCAGANCLALDTWSSLPIGTMDEGIGGAAIARNGAGLAMTTVSDFEVRLRTCSSNCAQPASWSAPTVIDHNNAITATLNPDSGSACSGRSESAAWWPRMPMLAINDRGFVVVHNPSPLVKCPGDPSPDRLPNIGRVIASY